jgi:hypothetical protein
MERVGRGGEPSLIDLCLTWMLGHTDSDDELTARDRSAIAQLAAAYCWFVDTADSEGLRRLFTHDALFAVGNKETIGRDEIVDVLVHSRRGTHVAGTLAMWPSLSGARACSRFIFIAASGGSPTTGGYEDDYIRGGDGWQIARRRVSLVIGTRPLGHFG